MVSAGWVNSLFSEWVKNDLIRPVLILVCAMLLFNLPTVVYKARMAIRGVLYFVLCWDKSYKLPQDPGAIFGPHLSQGLPVERKTVYFVRHGESTWNDTFNKGSHRSLAAFVVGFIPGLIKAVLYELYLLLSGKMDSKPLDGAEGEHLKILRGDNDVPRSKILCSNLRRAASTMVGGFRDRLARRPDDKMVIVDFLQEISNNPDTLSLTPAHTPIQASWIEKGYKKCNFQEIFDSQVDMSLHYGNKPLSTNGLKRMLEFCDFVFGSHSTGKDAPSANSNNPGPSFVGGVKESHIVVGGHSIWFRSFFKMFLPYSVHHVSKNKKIVNGGIVTFELMKAETKRGPKYMIDPKSIKVVYGGF